MALTGQIGNYFWGEKTKPFHKLHPMRIKEYIVTTTTKGDRFWEKTKEMAQNCSWVAGPRLHNLMKSYVFKSWERVFIAILDTQVVGYATFTEMDCIPNTQFKPFIGFVFVEEAHRGNKIGFKMINSIVEYAKSIGFKKLYVASNEKGLYEKMDFIFLEYQKDNWGNLEQVFVRNIY